MARYRRRPGRARIGRLLRALARPFRDEMAATMDEAGGEIARLMAARAPRKTGATARGIKHRMAPRALRMVVGLIGPQPGEKAPFYSRIQDLGRDGQTVTVRRSIAARASDAIGSGGARRVLVYRMQVRPMAAKRFVTGRFTEARAALRIRLNGIFERALRRMTGG